VHSRRESHKRLLIIKQAMNQNNKNSAFGRRILSTTFAILSAAFPVISANGQVQNEPSAIDTNPPRNAVVATIPVGSQPFGIAVSRKSDFVYVSNSGANTISVISTTSNTVVATYSVPNAGPLVVSADGKELYVASTTNPYGNGVTSGSGTKIVSEIKTSDGSAVKTFNVGSDPDGIVISPNGKEIWVLNYGDGSISIIDTATQAVLPGVIVPGGKLYLGAFSPNGKDFYAGQTPGPDGHADVSLIQTSSRKIIKQTIGDDGYGIYSGTASFAVSPNGQKFFLAIGADAYGYGYLLLGVSTANYKLKIPTGLIPANPAFRQLVVIPNSKYLYAVVDVIATEGPSTPEVEMFDTAKVDMEYGGPILSNVGGYRNMAIAPNGKFLYMSSSSANTVSVVDIRPL